MRTGTILATAVVAALGIGTSGFFIGNGISQLKSNNRSVNVRGLAEREVTADTATLSFSITGSGSSPEETFPGMAATQEKIIAALKQSGIKESEIQSGQWTTQRARPDEIKADPSLPLYTASGVMMIKTANVKAIDTVKNKMNELQIATGGAIGYSEVVYSFSGISKLRAEMIAAATKDARNAALQFAADSGSQVGSISNASQGGFQILSPGSDSDDPGSMTKIVRVVTTVTYELLD